ncbi:MAG: hypothetical protein BGN84_17920 [Afipia sp. 62-7]|jgi:hypothetical protein|uniref:hypothetical protein n=1 Tax=Tardiphaga sp. TaxID=1926292 RepID=UPI000927164B|nr:MAG: hypothetical protein BGN84_17920 [Afipia sp. 62-7]
MAGPRVDDGAVAIFISRTRVVTARSGDGPRAASKRFRVVQGPRGWSVVDDSTGLALEISLGDEHPLMRTEAEILCGCLNSCPEAGNIFGRRDGQIAGFPGRLPVASASREDD